MRSVAGIAVIVIFVMLAAVLAVRILAPGALATGDEQVRLAALVGWLAILGAGVFMASHVRIGHALRSLLIWFGIGLFLVAVYALRDDFGDLYAEVRGELMPYAPVEAPPAADQAPGAGAVSVRRSIDGHFWADANVNGASVRFLIDTGASTVALSQADARRVGIDPASLNYTARVSTAGGPTRGAPVRLDHIAVGGVRLENVEAIVIEGDVLPISLLGMSFLGRLSRYEATPDALILRR